MSVFKRWNGTSWETIGPQISSTRFNDISHMIAPEYSSTSIYNVDDYVVQSDKLYKCISAIESAEEWTPAHWTQISFSEEVSDLNSALSNIDDYTYLKEYEYIFASSFPNTGKIKKTDGEPDTSTSAKYSDYISVETGTIISGVLIVPSNGAPIACYNQNKEFMLSESFLDQIFSGTFTVPSGVKYVRLCYWTAYPSNFVTIENLYYGGIKNGVNSLATQVDNIKSDLYTESTVNETIPMSETLSGYKVTTTGIESGASNSEVDAYLIRPGKIEFYSKNASNDGLYWTYALFDAETLAECSQSTIIGDLRYFNKGIDKTNVLVVDQPCLLCITSQTTTHPSKATQVTIVVPISEYAQNQIGQLTNLYTNEKTNLVSAVNEIQRIASPRWRIDGKPTNDTHFFRIDAIDGCWLLVHHNDHVAEYLSDGTLVRDLQVISMRGNHKPALYCSGDWDYAIVYSADDHLPMIVQDASLFIGDSYIGLGNSRIAEQFGLNFYSSHWAYGHGGYTAKQVLDMVTGIPGVVSDYDPDYITAWGQGRFKRIFIYCGANIISYGTVSDVETLDDNTVEDNIPMNVVGSIADLLDGNSITVDGTTISTISDYYALFGNTTIGQYAFLIEYLQAVYPIGEIYMMGYVPWATITGREEFISTVCQRLEILYGARYINTFITTGYSKRNTSLITYDGVHLSPEGYQIYIQKMLKWYEHSLT